MEGYQKRAKIRSTASQIKFLVEYMGRNPTFAAGDFRGPLGSAGHEAEWCRLKSALDELGPPKSVQQWKFCWRDQKKKARAEGGSIKKARVQTGNNAIVPELSENSEIILGTIGHAMAVGVGPAESPIGYSLSQASCSTSVNSTLPRPMELDVQQNASSYSGDPQEGEQRGARRKIQPRHNAARRNREYRANPPEKFLKAQLEQNVLLKEIIKKIDEGNRIRSEQVRLMSEANALQREKLQLLHYKKAAPAPEGSNDFISDDIINIDDFIADDIINIDCNK